MPVLLQNPYQIFARAQTVWRSQRYPQNVTYVVHVRTTQGGKPEERHYHLRWDSATNRTFVNPISDEQVEHPYEPPPGFDFSILGVHIAHVGGPNMGTGIKDDLIGVPDLAPNYSFGIAPYVPPPPLTAAQIVQQIRTDFHDPAPQKVAQLAREQGGPKTIASVIASSAAYKISLVGLEQIDSHPDYHLALVPLREPHKYRLRDVWIDANSYATDKLRSDGNFVDGGTSSVPWTVSFQSIAGARYIAQETTDEPIAHWFDSITVSFENFSTARSRFDGSPLSSPIREPSNR